MTVPGGATSLDPLTTEGLSELHLEACFAAIRGYCRAQGITQEHFAACIGVTPVHLSYVLHRRREPGVKFLRGVEQAARLPPELKECLLQSLWAARQERGPEEQAFDARLRGQPLAELLVDVERRLIPLSNRPIEERSAARAYRGLYRECQALSARRAYVRQDPLAFVRLCTIQSEIAAILDRLCDSLATAALAERVAAQCDEFEPRSQVRELYAPRTQATRVKAVALYNLGSYRQAYDACLRMETSPTVRQRPEIWLPHIVRDKLKAMARVERFSLREAEQSARQGWQACERLEVEGEIAEMLSLLIDLSLVRCYLSHGGRTRLARARDLVRQHAQRMQPGRPSAITALHRVLYYRTVAEVERAWRGPRGLAENADFTLALRSALRIARQAGLANQLRKLTGQYGALAQELAALEGIELANG